MRARRLRLGLVAVLLVSAVGASVALTKHQTVDNVAVGSYREPTTTLDTTPFESAQASSDGPTTIPDGFFDPTSTTLPIPTTTSTTTTLPPPTTTLPIPPRQSDPICQGFVDMITLKRSGAGSIDDDPAGYAAKVSNNLRGWISALTAMDAQTYAGAIGKLQQVVAQLDDLPSAEEIRTIMDDLTAPDARTKPLVAHAMEVCPAVLAAR